MVHLILARIAAAIAILAVVSAFVFFGIEALPGDAATAVLGQNATPELVKSLRAEFGLDRPVAERYVEWLGGFGTGDLGRSLVSKRPIVDIVGPKAINTAVLALATLLIMIPLSIILAIASANRRDRALDYGTAVSTLVLIATPEFVVGSLAALVLGIWLKLFPPVSLVDGTKPILEQLNLLVLPVVTLLAASAAQTIRMVRACLIDVLDSPFIQMATLKGVRPRRVMYAHALPNAVGPTLQVLAFNVAWLIGGVVIVENVFQYPGLGMELTNAVTTRDLTLVTTIVMLVTAAYVLANLVGEVLTVIVDPRLRRTLK